MYAVGEKVAVRAESKRKKIKKEKERKADGGWG